MAVTFRCRQCGKVYRVSNDKAGARVRCKECRAVLRVPNPGQTSAEPAPPPTTEPRLPGRRKTRSTSKRRPVSSKRKSSSRVLIGSAAALVVIVGLGLTGFFLFRDSGTETRLVDNGLPDSVPSVNEAPQPSASDAPASTDADSAHQPTGEPVEETPAAVVSVSNQSVLPLSKANGWSEIPEFLQGAGIYAGTERPGRTLKFTVEKGGVVLMAASWDYDGNRSGGWYETRSTKADLLREDWVEIGSLTRDLDGNDHIYALFGRQVSDGESFRLHTRKYNPPFVIALDETQARAVLAQTEAQKTTTPAAEPVESQVARAESLAPRPAKSDPPADPTPPPTATAATATPATEPKTAPTSAEPDPADSGSKSEPVIDTSVDGLRVVNMTPEKLQEDRLPNYLRDAIVFRRPLNETDPAGGLLEFHVDKSQTILLQVKWDRSPLPEVRDQFSTRKELLRHGWWSAGPCPWAEGDELLYGKVTAPYRARIRTANFQPPWLIAAAPINVRDAEEEPEVPKTTSGPLTAGAALSHLRLEDYDWLEETANLFRTPLARHHSGHLKLIAFYEGLSSVPEKTETAYAQRIDQLRKWLEKYPESTAAHVSLAGCLRGYAWHARGTRSAAGVTEEQFELFHERLTEARQLVTPLAQRQVADPVVYQQIIWCGIGLGLPASRVDESIEAALRVDPLYVDILYDAANYYLPRWHGDRDDVVELADRAVRLTRDDLGLGAYAAVVDAVRRLHPNVFDDFDFSWDKAKQGFQDLIERFPHDPTYYDRACLAAAEAEDYDTVSEMLALIGDRPTNWIWPSEDYFRHFVRSYSAEAMAGDQRVLIRGNVDPITHLAISPDGRRVVSADMRDRIFIHNIQTGALEAMYQARLPFQTFAVLPIPNLVALGYGGGQINLCHVDVGNIQPLGDHDARIIGLETTADGSIMTSASRDGMIRIWERGNSEPQHTFNVPIKRALQAVAISNDGSRLAAVSDTGELHLCDVSSGRIITSWDVGIYPGSVAFSTAGDRLAVRSRVEPGAMSAVRITVWEVETQQEIARSEACKSMASIAFHPTKEVIAVAVADKESGGAFLWNYATDGAALEPLVGHKTGAFDCQFFADGQLATCGQDGTVRIWDTQ